MKKCSRCGEEKELCEFGVDRQKRDGLMSYCKRCKKIESVRYREANSEVISIKAKIIRSINKDSINSKGRDRYYRNYDYEKRRRLRYSYQSAKYATFRNSLTIDEMCKCADDGVSLKVKCKYCGKYFIPTNVDVIRRTQSLKGQVGGENNLYCSLNCKESCPTYGKHKYIEGFNNHVHSREVQAELRQLVFEFDEWKCQRCGATTQEAELHCHHLTGVELNPIESADVDNCITLCKLHHLELHQREGCTYADFRRKTCKVEED